MKNHTTCVRGIFEYNVGRLVDGEGRSAREGWNCKGGSYVQRNIRRLESRQPEKRNEAAESTIEGNDAR